MTPAQKRPEREPPLQTDSELGKRLRYLLKQALRRQIWLVFLDAQNRLIDPIMPMSDHPQNARELIETSDFGLVTFCEAFMRRAKQISEAVRARSYVIVWERPGSETVSHDDREWANGFVEHSGKPSGGGNLRAMFLLHDGGLRQFVPDDLL